MQSLTFPVDVINYICEFAAGTDCMWYPVFSPKNGKLDWKLNKYSHKLHMKISNVLNRKIEEGFLMLFKDNSVFTYTYMYYMMINKCDYNTNSPTVFVCWFENEHGNTCHMVIEIFNNCFNHEWHSSPENFMYLYENNNPKYQILKLTKTRLHANLSFRAWNLDIAEINL